MFVIFIVNNHDTPLVALGDIAIVLDSGAEVIAGSTRMGAGTAQKAALNLLSTLTHIRLGAVHDGMMVNVQAGNLKLKQRAAEIVANISGGSLDQATHDLNETNAQVKPDVLLFSGAENFETSQLLLASTKGNLRLALSQLTHHTR